MNTNQGVPRLNLAPKLNRPLQLWNPFDYLRLLYWVFFFPQALRWYVEVFAAPEHCEATGRDLLSALRQDRAQRDLVFQSLILVVFTLLILGTSLQHLSVPVEWISVALGVAISAVGFLVLGLEHGVAYGVVLGVVLGIAFGIAFGVVIGLTGNTALLGGDISIESGTALSVASGISFGIAVGIVGGIVFSMAVGTESSVARGTAFVMALGAAFSIVLVTVFGVVFGLAHGLPYATVGGVVRGLVHGVAGSVVFVAAGAVAFVVAGSVALLRLPTYVVLAPLSRWARSQEEQRKTWRVSRLVPLPQPEVQKWLETWLAQDWVAGVANVNQLLAYTLQFIPAVRAVSTVLTHLPDEDLLAAVGELVDEPFDWDLVRFNSASLRNEIWNAAIDNFLILPRRVRRHWRVRFPAELRIDIPVRAACAGFWYMHKGEMVKASDAFAIVRSLPGGEELYLIASSLAAAIRTKDAVAVSEWLEVSGRLAELPGPHLRPAVLRTIHRLRDVAAEADLASHAVSLLMRSSATGRAVASLTRLLEDVEETCPQPEAAIVKAVAEQWFHILVAAGGRTGEQVLRQPVENPYEGYSGMPVERTFVGREGVLARLERLWATSVNVPLPPIILYGHRRMGKSSIILHLYRHRSPEMLIARTDMQDLTMADHTGQLLLGFARAVHGAVREARLIAGSVPDADDYATTGAARMALNALLEHLDPQMSGQRLILAVDEYEIAEMKIEEGKFDPDFLRYLRWVAQRYRWLGLLFAGRQTLEDELRHYRAVFFGSAEPVQVSFLTREAALHLIRQPSDDFALEYEDALAEELCRLTNGQPYLLQRLCWELVNRWNDRFLREGDEISRVLTLADLETLLTPKFYHDFFLQADYYFSGVWDEAGPNEHRLLTALVAREDAMPLPRAELIRAAGLAPDEADAAIQAALRRDLIVEAEVKGSGSFRLTIPLMRHWIHEASTSIAIARRNDRGVDQ